MSGASTARAGGREAAAWALAVCVSVCCACRPGVFDELESGEAANQAGASDAAAREESEAGSDDDAGAETSPSDAGSEADAGCGDTARDPLNCGSCGFDCSADYAIPACVNARCSRRCEPAHEDCNRDLMRGSEGDGCETRTDSDSKNCGGCDVRCVASPYGYASCRAQACVEHAVKLVDVEAGSLHGSPTGGGVFPASQLCAPDEVLIGVSGVGDVIAYSLQVHCARVALSRTAGGYAVQVVPTRSSEPVGGLIGPEPPPPFERACPQGAIVTGVAGAVWLWPGQSTYSVRQISLRCAAVSVDAERRLLLTDDVSVTIGDTDDPSIVGFSDDCGAGRAVAGFSGRSGAYLDAIATHCGALGVAEEAATTASPR